MLASTVVARPEIIRAQAPDDALARTLADVERKLAARLGAVVLDTHSGRTWTQRAGERFPLCSTFKAIAAGAVLARVDAGTESLDRRIRFETADVVTYSPVTKDRAGGEGMTLAELCEAAITLSDNTAGNMILKSIGGPPGFTDFVRSLGDTVTRLDRWETELNEAQPGDPRDTTMPQAMAGNLQALVLGSTLSSASRDRLAAWLVANKTGNAKLRAGLPKEWRIGDKTGAGNFGTMNDVAVIWPPGRRPVIVSIYMTETKASFDDRNAGIAEIARSLRVALAG
jgi:beta-lactamase class A